MNLVLSKPYLFWGKTGKIAHVLSLPSDIAQKTIFWRLIAEATCRLEMRCWCQNIAKAALSLIYSTAEYCVPVWCRSDHTCLIDNVLNDALRIVTGYLRPTPTDHLSIFLGTLPTELCRLKATLFSAYRGYLDPDHILYGLLSGSSDVRQERLNARLCQQRVI